MTSAISLRRALYATVFTLGGALVSCSSSTTACSSPSDCSGSQVCVYPIGSCSAHGQCLDRPDDDSCGDFYNPACGCDGKPVAFGCGYPEGYASAPTTGSTGVATCDEGDASDAG